MRIRATVAAVSGALAISTFALPAAHAADSADSFRADVAKVLQAAHAASGKTAFSSSADAEPQPYPLDATFSNFKIAKAIKVGTTADVSTKVTYTMTHGADVDITADDFLTAPFIYRGDFDNLDTPALFGDNPATCTATSATIATCTGLITAHPGQGELSNSEAGTWKGAALAIAFNGQDPTSDTFDITKVGYTEKGDLGSTLVQRNSRLTVNATPEPVNKGKTITVVGKLSRANWEDNKYHGYSTQPVQLQFRKKGSSTYTTLKTIKTSTTGDLKTTTTATVDGYYRYAFAGTSTTPAVNATGDFVDVQ
ncbi:hypothetical protein [Streptomyces longisporus]|uniref:Lipoprotein n=1 Tax=Streptomyces longisporus TaxID=1948 RepID=A0ABN3LCX1_STRLO